MSVALQRSLSRAGRYVASYLLAVAVTMLCNWLSGLQLPDFAAPVIAAIIAALGKYVRETLKIRVIF